MSYSMTELIQTKRDGGHLEPAELEWIIERYTADVIPDYQLSALMMAIMFRGMSQVELAAWTDAMLHSGDVLDLSSTDMPKIDKHSTGGVGDKISIPLAPLVVACGVAIPMMSGRGLGHTGGTLDKLEAIPGFRTRLDPDEFASQLDDLGLVLAGQSETLVPADRRIYSLRDASGTVPSVPLISSTISPGILPLTLSSNQRLPLSVPMMSIAVADERATTAPIQSSDFRICLLTDQCPA